MYIFIYISSAIRSQSVLFSPPLLICFSCILYTYDTCKCSLYLRYKKKKNTNTIYTTIISLRPENTIRDI